MSAPRKFLLVGLTGGIATGKSTVSHMLRGLGAEIIDADLLARAVVEPGRPAWHEIVGEFGAHEIRLKLDQPVPFGRAAQRWVDWSRRPRPPGELPTARGAGDY